MTDTRMTEKSALKREIPGTATPRATLTVTGEVYEVTQSDPRVVGVRTDLG